MTSGLACTFRVLTETKNEAAIDLLLAALDSPVSEIRLAALRAVVERRSLAGHRELVRRWHTFSPEWKSYIAKRATRLEGAVRAAILCTDPELHENACDAVVHLRDYDLIPSLITAAEDKGNPRAECSAKALVEMCDRLYEELTTPSNYREGRDPALIKQYVYTSLESAITRFEHHLRAELLESFLLLMQPEDSLLHQFLRPQASKLHSITLSVLTTSQRKGILELLLGCLEDPHIPSGLFIVLSRRHDAPFLKLLFKMAKAELCANARTNLRKVESFAWLRDDASLIKDFNDDEVAGAVELVMASGVSRLRAFEMLKVMLHRGGVLTRRAASLALAQFKGGEANDLALTTLEDADPEVQANGVRQLRDRGIPGVMPRLVELIASPHEIVREAARQSLAEFNFQRYLSAFEMLEPEVRRCSGSLVKKVDPQAIEQLRVELVSPSRTRRLRGLEVAIAMEAFQEVEEHILQLATDNDHFIRAEAARALVNIHTEQARRVLHDLLLDRSVSVQEAAQKAMDKAGLSKFAPPPATPLPALEPGTLTSPPVHEASP